jgi:hypothetical protein
MLTTSVVLILFAGLVHLGHSRDVVELVMLGALLLAWIYLVVFQNVATTDVPATIEADETGVRASGETIFRAGGDPRRRRGAAPGYATVRAAVRPRACANPRHRRRGRRTGATTYEYPCPPLALTRRSRNLTIRCPAAHRPASPWPASITDVD